MPSMSPASQMVQSLNQKATTLLNALEGLDSLLSRNSKQGGTVLANLQQSDITAWNPKTALTPASVQAFAAALSALQTIRTAKDATALAAAMAALTTAATALYAQSPPVALESLTITMAQG